MREITSPIAPSVRRTVMLQGMDLRQTTRCQREFSALEKSVPDNAHAGVEKNGADARLGQRPWAGEPLGAGSGVQL